MATELEELEKKLEVLHFAYLLAVGEAIPRIAEQMNRVAGKVFLLKIGAVETFK